MAIITQIVILMTVLAAMVMVLLGIRQLTSFEGFEDADDTKRLKDEIDEDDRIISKSNIFHNLVESDKSPDEERIKKERVYNDKLKDPFSRKE